MLCCFTLCVVCHFSAGFCPPQLPPLFSTLTPASASDPSSSSAAATASAVPKSHKTLESERKTARMQRMPLQHQRLLELKHLEELQSAASASASASASAPSDPSLSPNPKKLKTEHSAVSVPKSDSKSDSDSASASASASGSAACALEPEPVGAAQAAGTSTLSTPHIPVPPVLLALSAHSRIEIAVSHLPLLVAGRYCKFSRELPQSPWLMAGKRFVKGSVEESITAALTAPFATGEYRVTASGRGGLPPVPSPPLHLWPDLT